MNDSEIYANLTDIFRSLFARDDLVLTPTTTAKDIAGWNSFQQIEIILAVEERFTMTLNSTDVDSLENVGDLARIIATKTRTR